MLHDDYKVQDGRAANWQQLRTRLLRWELVAVGLVRWGRPGPQYGGRSGAVLPSLSATRSSRRQAPAYVLCSALASHPATTPNPRHTPEQYQILTCREGLLLQCEPLHCGVAPFVYGTNARILGLPYHSELDQLKALAAVHLEGAKPLLAHVNLIRLIAYNDKRPVHYSITEVRG